MKIPNIDTLSNLIDRLITENIKKLRFLERGMDEQVSHQEILIHNIKENLQHTLNESIFAKSYDFMIDQRTFRMDDLFSKIETLVLADLAVGLGEHTKVELTNHKHPNYKLMHLYILLARVANEIRANTKNDIDKELGEIINGS